jgi:hypothetical protein
MKTRPMTTFRLAATLALTHAAMPGTGAPNAHAAPPASTTESTLFYGGFAYAGAAGTAAQRYPWFSKANQPETGGVRLMDRVCREHFQSLGGKLNPCVRLKIGALAGARDIPLVFAVALGEELVLREKIGNFHKIVISLGFNLLVLDFDSLDVVSSHPFFIELIDAAPARRADDEIVSLVRGMVAGTGSMFLQGVNLNLKNIRASGENQVTLQVREIEIGEKAVPFLPPELAQNKGLYAEWVAQQFSSIFGSKARVAMLPFSKDGLNATMSLVFEDASRLQFKIPQPTFAIDLNLRGFKKVKGEETAAETAWIFGAFVDLKITEPEFGKVYYENKFKHPVTKTTPASQSEMDEFPIVSEALKGCFGQIAETMGKDRETREKILHKHRL